MDWFTPGSSASWFGPTPNRSQTLAPPSDLSLSSPLFAPAPAPQQSSAAIQPYSLWGAPPSPDPTLSLLSTARQGVGGLSRLLGSSGTDIGGSGLNLSDALGPLGLASGAMSGNPYSLAGGALGTAGTLSRLAGYGAATPYLGGLGGLLGVAGGIQGLVNGGSVPSSLMSLGSGLAGTYGALSTLAPSIFPSLTGMIGSALGGTLANTALGAGVTGGAAAGAGTGAAAAGSLGAGLTGGIVALPMAAALIATQLSNMSHQQDAAFKAESQYKKLAGYLPESLNQWQALPGVLDQSMSPQNSADALRNIANINAIRDPFINSGLYDFLETGSTTGRKADAHVSIPFAQGPAIYKAAYEPGLNAMNSAFISNEDLLAKNGVQPNQIPDYQFQSMSPWELGLLKLQQAGIQTTAPQWVTDAYNKTGMAPSGYTRLTNGNFMPSGMYDSLLSLQGGSAADALSGRNSFLTPTVGASGLAAPISALVSQYKAAPPVYQTFQDWNATPEGQQAAMIEQNANQAFTSGGS